MNKAIIKTKNLSKVFKLGGQKVVAVDNVNLQIKEGEFLSIMGPSGSGKTTLLNLLGLLEIPTSGEIYFDDTAVSKLSDIKRTKLRLSKIGFVFQTFNLLPNLSAWENVALPGLLAKAPYKLRRERAKELLELMGLSLRFNHYPSQLSAGEQQRVAIARALFNRPKIILADEPTGNLDSKTKKEIAILLKEINKKEKTAILIVTHDVKVAQFTDKIFKMVDGRVLKND